MSSPKIGLPKILPKMKRQLGNRISACNFRIRRELAFFLSSSFLKFQNPYIEGDIAERDRVRSPPAEDVAFAFAVTENPERISTQKDLPSYRVDLQILLNTMVKLWRRYMRLPTLPPYLTPANPSPSLRFLDATRVHICRVLSPTLHGLHL